MPRHLFFSNSLILKIMVQTLALPYLHYNHVECMNKIFCLFFIFIPFLSTAQIITTIAGGGTGGDGRPATAATIYDPNYLTFDSRGNLYFTECLGNKIRKIDTQGIITTICGTGTAGFSGDGGSATAAMVSLPCGIAVDSIGNIYFADNENNRVRKIDAISNVISTVIGNSSGAFAGDGGMATAATLYGPCGIAFDKKGNLYIVDADNARIRKVNIGGIIYTIAGDGSFGWAGDGGAATNASCEPSTNLSVDIFGNVYFPEWGLGTVRKIDTSGIIATIAGDTSSSSYNGDGIPATNANMGPAFVEVNDSGQLFISDSYNSRIRRVDTNGIIFTSVGDGIAGNTGNGGNADSAQIDGPSGLVFDACQNLYMGQVNVPRIRKVTFNSTCNALALKTHVISKTKEISIYPNPAFAHVTITCTEKIKQIILNDIFRRTIYHQVFDAEKAEINVSAFPPGIYFVQVTDGTGNVFVRKVLKE